MAEAKNDAETLSKVLTHLDSIAEKMDAFGKRMDSMEMGMADSAKKWDSTCSRLDAWEEKEKKDSARKDAEKEEEEKRKADAARAEEEAKADKAKKDAEEEEKKKADAARADSATFKKMQEQIDALTRIVPANLPADMRARMVGHQAKAERVAQAFGDSAGAPPAVNGEGEQDYRIRLLGKYKAHSKKFKDADLSKIQDAAVFDMIEEGIYADALQVANHPTDIPPNVLIPRITTDATGRKITRYIGRPDACWGKFKLPTRFVKRFGDEKTGQTCF